MKKRVVIELTEEQAQVTLAALEEYFRLRYGQGGISGLADDLAFATYDRNKDHTGAEFDLAIQRRDSINYVLKAAFQIAWPIYGGPDHKSDVALIAGDVWSQLRWDLSTKEPYMTRPIQLGPEPMPVIKVIVEEEPNDRAPCKNRNN